jgi:hypothetical protein
METKFKKGDILICVKSMYAGWERGDRIVILGIDEEFGSYGFYEYQDLNYDLQDRVPINFQDIFEIETKTNKVLYGKNEIPKK